MSREQPTLTRSEVRALLTHYRVTGHAPPTDEQVTVWLGELRAHSAGECHAALTAMQADHHGPVTPAAVLDRIRHARTHPSGRAVVSAVPTRRADVDRDRTRTSGARGIRAVYAAMGWQRHPDHDAARSIRCPFCKARPGEVCSPLSRDRAGRREHRDHATLMHPSRVAAARSARTPVETTR